MLKAEDEIKTCGSPVVGNEEVCGSGGNTPKYSALCFHLPPPFADQIHDQDQHHYNQC